jgi:hypothetical protein
MARVTRREVVGLAAGAAGAALAKYYWNTRL